MVGMADARREENSDTNTTDTQVHKVRAVFEGRWITVENAFRSKKAADAYVAVLEANGAERAHSYAYTDAEYVAKREAKPAEWEGASVK